MPNDYLTVEEFNYRGRAEAQPDSTDDEWRIEPIITEASRLVDDLCGVEYGAFATGSPGTSATRYFERGGVELWIDPAVSLSAVAISEDGGSSYTSLTADTDYWKSDGKQYDTTPYRLLVVNPNSSTLVAFPSGRRAVRITGVWGWSETVPPVIRDVTFRLAQRAYLMKESGGSEERAVATAEGVWLPAGAVPKDVLVKLAAYRGRRTG